MKNNEKNQSFLVYLHKNKINNKCYVGQTIYTDNPNLRWRNGAGYSSQKDFFEDINKFGWDNFQHIILETNIPSILIQERENYWINFYDCLNPEKGYNKKESGSYGHLSEDAKKNISNGWSEKTRKEQSQRMKQKWQKDKNFKEKALTALKNSKKVSLTGEKNGMYGIHRYGKESPRHKKVQCINTGQVFETIKEAALWTGSIGQKSHISAVCKGTRNFAGKHPITKELLKWRYYNTQEEENED